MSGPIIKAPKIRNKTLESKIQKLVPTLMAGYLANPAYTHTGTEHVIRLAINSARALVYALDKRKE